MYLGLDFVLAFQEINYKKNYLFENGLIEAYTIAF